MSARTKISAFILLVLALHALPVLSYQGAQQTRWPFLVWAMYARSTPPGPIRAFLYELYAVPAQGAARRITAREVGLSTPAFNGLYIGPFSRGDTAAGRWLLDRLNRIGPDSVVRLRLETHQYRLVDPGIAVDTLPAIVFPAATPATTR